MAGDGWEAVREMKPTKDKKKEALVTVALKDFVRRLYFKDPSASRKEIPK